MNKRIMKVITLILSCLLLIGAAVGITVAAEENSDYYVEIYKKNVAYEGKVQIVYLVDTNYEGGTVMIDFGGYKKAAKGEFTLDDQTFDVVYSNGIAAKDYKKTITATPYVVDAEGNTVATGASVKFSPVAYVLDRLNGENAPSAEQRTLYDALLDYGAAVQKVLGDTGSLANDYEEITLVANGGECDVESMYVATGVPYALPEAYIDNAVLLNWVTADGKSVAATGNSWPADVSGELTAAWGVESVNFVDFDAGAPTSDKFYNGATSSAYSDGVLNLIIGGNSTATAVKPVADVTEPKAGMKYIWQFDVAYNGSDYGEISAGNNLGFGWFGFYHQRIGDNSKLAVPFNLNWGADTDGVNGYDRIIFQHGGDVISVFAGETATIRLEYVVGSNSTAFYVNDEYKFSRAHTPSAETLVGAGFSWRAPGNNYVNFDIQLDNVFLAVQTPLVQAKATLDANGGEVDGEEVSEMTVYPGGSYELPTPYRAGAAFWGWYDEDGNLVANTGSWAFEEDVTLTAKWANIIAETVVDFDDGTIGNCAGVPVDANKMETDVSYEGGMVTFTPSREAYFSVLFRDENGAIYNHTEPVEGEKYVFEFDFTYNSATYNSGLINDWSGIGWIGFVNPNGWSNTFMLHRNTVTWNNQDSNADGIIDSLNMFGQVCGAGQTRNFKIVYTVGTKAVPELYVDGVLIPGGGSFTAQSIGTTEQLRGFCFMFRGAGRWGDINVSIDNVRLAIESPMADAE